MDDMESEDPNIQELGNQIGGLVIGIQEALTILFIRIRQRVLQTTILLCVLLLMLWVAIFLYGSFYYSFMPTASFITPVHFYYRTDCPTPYHSICSFPMANFSLLKNGKKQVMTYGQPYQITLELEMPESPVNEQLGMFLVKMSCYSSDGQVVDTAARSTMLHFRSRLLNSLGTLAFFPLLLMGATEQKQYVLVELYSSYVDNSYKPTVGAVVEIYSQQVQIYKSQLYIHAHFTGIRYILYNFPLASAVVGVLSNFIFLSMLILFSYLQMALNGIWPNRQNARWNQFRQRRRDVPEATGLYERNAQPEDNNTGSDVFSLKYKVFPNSKKNRFVPFNQPKGPKTNMSGASVVGPSDITSSSKMEESILDAGVEDIVEINNSKCCAENHCIPEARNEDIYLKLRFLSEGVSDPPADATDKAYYRTGTCLSS